MVKMQVILLKKNNLDGIDFNMENLIFKTFGTNSHMDKDQTIDWLVDATKKARDILGLDAIITHSPQSPYFNELEFLSGYLDFYKKVGNTIDYFLIQYYNQGDTYLTYKSQFIENEDRKHPGTAVKELIDRGIPKEIIIVGKAMQKHDAKEESLVDPKVIHDWVVKAKDDPDVYQWNTGISTWQWHTKGDPGEPVAKTWINTIYPK